jgi:hypothetical protein
MSPKLVAVLVGVVVALAAHVEVAHAQAVRAFAGVAASDPRLSTVSPNDPRLSIVGPNDPRLLRVDPRDPRLLQVPQAGSAPAHQPGDALDRPPRQSRHQPPIVIVTQPIVIESAPSSCWIPGHWEYRWVPETSSYSAWIPGQWTADGQWIEGRYESRVTSWGSWQPLWVPDTRAC